MPLVVVTGVPSSGKTSTCERLKEALEEKGRRVHLVSEAEYVQQEGGKNDTFKDSKKEKVVRGSLKSEVLRLLHPEHVVLLDGLNYIKGFRYELYCASKAAKTTQCTVHCDVSKEMTWQWNNQRSSNNLQDKEQPYEREVFDALWMRYETPVASNRWDSPLLLSLAEVPLDADAVDTALFNRKPPPPNQSTQCQPLSDANFLQELDRVTRAIITAILDAQKSGCCSEGHLVAVPGSQEKYQYERRVTMAELARVKRQFITYVKARSIDNLEKLATIFVQYLNSSLNTDL